VGSQGGVSASSGKGGIGSTRESQKQRGKREESELLVVEDTGRANQKLKGKKNGRCEEGEHHPRRAKEINKEKKKRRKIEWKNNPH